MVIIVSVSEVTIYSIISVYSKYKIRMMRISIVWILYQAEDEDIFAAGGWRFSS